MNKLKLISAAVIALLGIIIIVQNQAPVETKILFLTVTMPRFILLLITAMLGFAVGLLTAFGFKWKRSVAATAS
ncbi:MAG TPA: DUF1049 domain-containing protein [Verrucomicrobiales bacterium]|nr:DUF1049 domain-containing protein [Verrucomicrobiales bacterium]